MIETRTAKVWLGDDGIIRLVSLGVSSEGVTIARENWEAINQVSQGKIRPVFADIRNVKTVGAEERRFYARVETKDLFSAVAMLVDSPLSRVIGSFFLGLNRLPIPIRLFTSEEHALEWLRGFLEKESK